MRLRSNLLGRLQRRLKHECGAWAWDCQCGYTTAAIITAIVVAAAGTAYGAYSANEAQQQQAEMQKRVAQTQATAAQQQADAEQQAGEARARQIQYNADRIKKTFLSREAGAGVQVGQGSLLESEGQYAFDTEYSKQLARYPHELAGSAAAYQAQTAMYHSALFGFQRDVLAGRQGLDTGIAGVSSVAGSATRLYSSLAARSVTPVSQVDV